MTLGELRVNIIGARDLPELQGCKCCFYCGTQSPYFNVGFLGKRQWTSKTISSGGTKPMWNERNDFQIGSERVTEIMVEIWNKNCLCSDDLIAQAKIPLFEVFNSGQDDRYASLTDRKGVTAGELHIVLSWHEQGASTAHTSAHSAAHTSAHSATAPQSPPQPVAAPAPQVTVVQAPPQQMSPQYGQPGAPPTYPQAYPPAQQPAYAAVPATAYPPNPGAPPPAAYPPPPAGGYPPPSY